MNEETSFGDHNEAKSLKARDLLIQHPPPTARPTQPSPQNSSRTPIIHNSLTIFHHADCFLPLVASPRSSQRVFPSQAQIFLGLSNKPALLAMTPQATPFPAAPSILDSGADPRPRLSTPSLITRDLPMMSPTLRTPSTRRKEARPEVSATTLPRSPAWRNASVGAP